MNENSMHLFEIITYISKTMSHFKWNGMCSQFRLHSHSRCNEFYLCARLCWPPLMKNQKNTKQHLITKLVIDGYIIKWANILPFNLYLFGEKNVSSFIIITIDREVNVAMLFNGQLRHLLIKFYCAVAANIFSEKLLDNVPEPKNCLDLIIRDQIHSDIFHY